MTPALSRASTPTLLVSLLLAAGAQAAEASCPKPAEVTPQQLVGLWRAEFAGQAPGATLLLQPHREYAQSLSGEINRDGTRARVAADLEEGEFTLEESADGLRINATWLGDVVEGSCGQEIRGRREGGWDGTLPFVLRKLP
ncbi:hypothetical protein EZ313_10505 [Ramlibacter henchirensis]|uniref:Lipocalin-like domain-containing protein n=1 Tax=Ramlibacter henchirensis TaxID=204072 RepID=A0A4Z0C9E2_9BURK|nr:hypothetical protein [Ramlibacter henchirensis]TFZ07020.1 hypothetical protein EZ313_10505 [Ramlibacter henchirensis]